MKVCNNYSLIHKFLISHNLLQSFINRCFWCLPPKGVIQGVSEMRVLILTSGRTRQIMELFSITFLRKSNTN
jgi:hypothetical protein